jgi:hypothetical protein
MQNVNDSVFNLDKVKNYMENEFYTGAKDNKNISKFRKSASNLDFAHLIFSHRFRRMQRTIRMEKFSKMCNLLFYSGAKCGQNT